MLDRYPTLEEATTHSQRVLEQARGFVTTVKRDVQTHIAIYVVGSYGRVEAHPAVSDFEWLLVYDDSKVNPQEADLFQAEVTRGFASIVGRDRLSIGKTFGSLCRVADLRSNIGGIADTNHMLTYRMLVLAEGVPLVQNAAYQAALGCLAGAYGATHTAGHRLLSLATDIARHWRTLRIDYKH